MDLQNKHSVNTFHDKPSTHTNSQQIEIIHFYTRLRIVYIPVNSVTKNPNFYRESNFQCLRLILITNQRQHFVLYALVALPGSRTAW